MFMALSVYSIIEVREMTLNALSLARRVSRSSCSPLARNPPSSEPVALKGNTAMIGMESMAATDTSETWLVRSIGRGAGAPPFRSSKNRSANNSPTRHHHRDGYQIQPAARFPGHRVRPIDL